MLPGGKTDQLYRATLFFFFFFNKGHLFIKSEATTFSTYKSDFQGHRCLTFIKTDCFDGLSL